MIAIACDHGGYTLKQTVIAHLTEQGYEVKDFGCNSLDSCDYPDFGIPAAQAVAGGSCEKGILICTTGIGMCITANKVRGIRCALCGDTVSASLTRQHNDTNMLAIGAGITGPNLALAIVDTGLNTAFVGGRHQRRIDKFMKLEEQP